MMGEGGGMLGRSASRNTLILIASTAVILSVRSPSSAGEKFDNFAHPYPGQTGALGEDLQKEIIPPGSPPPSVSTSLKAGEPIWIPSGKSRVIHVDAPIRRVSIGNPDLAGIVVLGPRTIMVNAKEAPRPENAGGGAGGSVSNVGTITGHTLTPEPRFGETTLAVWHSGSEEPDIHTLFIADFVDRQVLLEVTVAEVLRTAAEEFGIDFRNAANAFVSAYFMGGGAGPSPSGTSLVPSQGVGLLPIGTGLDRPVYAFNLPKSDITAFIMYLQREQLAKVLAQPKLLAMSGQTAVFQVGGEIPIRIATGFATDVVFKPFGTLVTFVPRVSDEGDIMLTVTPEVSEAVFSQPVEGIPTFRTRRASTSTRLKDGETLIIGGLLQDQRAEAVDGIPYLQDIPFIGIVFRHTVYADTLSEMVVTVTPHLARPIKPGEDVALPTDRGPLTNEEIRTKPNPFEATRPRIPGLP
jgi:Flp pilus assembly secretin CpaC